MFIDFHLFCNNFCTLLYSVLLSDSLSEDTKLSIVSDLTLFLNKLKSYLEDSIK